MDNKEQASDFITKHTQEVDGKKQINMITVVIELFARIKTLQQQVQLLESAMGEVALAYEEMSKDIDELKGNKKIEVVSVEEANKILKG